MKVVFLLLHDFRFAGWGLDQFLSRFHFSKEYARRISGEGNDVSLYTFHQDVRSIKTIKVDEYTIKVFPVEMYFPPHMPFGNAHSLMALKELKHDKPDIVHFHNYYIWSFPYVSTWTKFNGMKIVAQYHGESDRLKALRRIFTPLLRSADLFLAPLSEEISYLTNKFKVPSWKVSKFPNVGVDTDLFYPVCNKSDEPTLLYVGRMTLPSRNIREKSPWRLIDVMYELTKTRRNVKMFMVGDGPGLSYLRAVAKRRRLDRNVIFAGYRGNTELPMLYSKSWITFIPMQLGDIDPFWDGSLKESLSCMTPVAGFNDQVSCLSDSCRRLGYLIPSNPKNAAGIIHEILEDKDRLDEVGTKGRSSTLKCCSWNAVIERLLHLYRSLT